MLNSILGYGDDIGNETLMNSHVKFSQILNHEFNRFYLCDVIALPLPIPIQNSGKA